MFGKHRTDREHYQKPTFSPTDYPTEEEIVAEHGEAGIKAVQKENGDGTRTVF